MKQKITVGVAVAALFAGFLPMAESEAMFVSIGHIGGMSYLMYLLGVLVVAVAVSAMYRPAAGHLQGWLAALGGAGVLLTMVTVSTAKGHLAYMAGTFSMMGNLMDGNAAAPQLHPAIGSGGMLALAGFAGVLACGMWGRRTAPAAVKAEGGN